uniref:Uncharacterized protein n=1 Tax=Parascaris equorum TaxID=6256 RepID=A0A914RR75_PAREQ
MSTSNPSAHSHENVEPFKVTLIEQRSPPLAIVPPFVTLIDAAFQKYDDDNLRPKIEFGFAGCNHLCNERDASPGISFQQQAFIS